MKQRGHQQGIDRKEVYYLIIPPKNRYQLRRIQGPFPFLVHAHPILLEINHSNPPRLSIEKNIVWSRVQQVYAQSSQHDNRLPAMLTDVVIRGITLDVVSGPRPVQAKWQSLNPGENEDISLRKQR